MAGGMRKVKGTFKTSKGSSEYKALDYAITKATNHKRQLPKEKHVRTIFYTLAPSTPRIDVVYCLCSLSSRLGQTHNWAVALKTLLIIHRAMRELDNTVWEEFISYSREREHMLNVLHFRDGSSPDALDYSAWIHNYALYLDERLRCYVMLSYDAVTYTSKDMKLETHDLLQQLPYIQELQSRLLQCKPRGAALYNPLIQYALSIVATESVKLYVATTIRVVTLLDKFFEMSRTDAIRALEIYKKSGNQAHSLAAFFETCRGMEFGRGQKFINIKESPASFMATLEDYIKEAPSTLTLERQVITDDEQGTTAKENAASDGDLQVDDEQDGDVKENSDPSKAKNEAAAAPQVADLLGLDDLLTGASEFEQNSYALAIVPIENSSKAGNGENVASQATVWELALFAEPSSNEDAAAEPECKSDQELKGSAEDSVNGGGMGGTEQNRGYQMGCNPFEGSQGAFYPYPPAPTMPHPTSQGDFYPYPPPPQGQQDMSYQQLFTMQHQQQQQQQQSIVMNQKSTNPFD